MSHQSAKHEGHDVWPLISRPGIVWCRTCQVHYVAPAPRWTSSGKPIPFPGGVR